MKNYLVLYQAGKAGTWLTWLINQHANFPQYETIEQERDNLKQQLDIACLGADFYWQEHSYTESLRLSQRFVVNQEYTKRCVKVIPNHELRSIEDPSKPDVEYLDKVIPQLNPDLIVWPILSDTMIREFTLRWYVIWHVSRGMMPGEQHELEYFREGLLNVFQHRAVKIYSRYAPVYQVDVGKLIKADYHEDEYIRLANAIGEEPLADISRIALDYRMWAFADIMDKVGSP